MGRKKKVFGFAALAVSVLSVIMCTKKEPPAGGDSQIDTDEGQEQEKEPERPLNVKDTLYVTGVEYPAGYDWFQDSQYGEVKCFIFLEKNGKRVLRVPVGHEYETASDIDMHRCFEGHLYTDYSSDSETVVKKDGEEVFRFRGREMIVSFYVRNGNIYTLGAPRSGENGLILRINGKKEEFYEGGVVLSGFHEDQGRLCFTFAQEHESAPDGWIYKAYIDGNTGEFASESGISRVFDAKVFENQVCYIAECKDLTGRGYCCYRGEYAFPLDIGDYDFIERAHLLVSSSSLYVCGICSDTGGSFRKPTGMRGWNTTEIAEGKEYFVWDCYGYKYGYGPNIIPDFSFLEEDTIYDFHATASAFPELCLSKDGNRQYTYGRNRWVLSPEPAAFLQGHMYFVFSGSSMPYEPFFAVDENVEGGDFNGFYSSVSLW